MRALGTPRATKFFWRESSRHETFREARSSRDKQIRRGGPRGRPFQPTASLQKRAATGAAPTAIFGCGSLTAGGQFSSPLPIPEILPTKCSVRALPSLSLGGTSRRKARLKLFFRMGQRPLETRFWRGNSSRFPNRKPATFLWTRVSRLYTICSTVSIY